VISEKLSGGLSEKRGGLSEKRGGLSEKRGGFSEKPTASLFTYHFYRVRRVSAKSFLRTPVRKDGNALLSA